MTDVRDLRLNRQIKALCGALDWCVRSMYGGPWDPVWFDQALGVLEDASGLDYSSFYGEPGENWLTIRDSAVEVKT